MNEPRTLLVGGLSSIHDPLFVAALRGRGYDAVLLHPRTDAGLRRARALGNHGQCNPAHYLVGAVLEHARSSGSDSFGERHAWLTVGSCGPCRLAAYRMEYDRVLQCGGLGDLPIISLDQLSFARDDEAQEPHAGLGRRTADALLTALVVGDAVAQLAHALRPYAIDPVAVDELVSSGRARLVSALEQELPLAGPLAWIGTQGRRVRLDLGRVLPRALIVGEPWTTLSDGDPSYDLARRLELSGVEVAAPSAADWLRYQIWAEIGRAQSRRSLLPGPSLEALRSAEERLRVLLRQCFTPVGLEPPAPDLDAVAALAGPHYAPDVRGGSAHLEVGRALLAAQQRSVHLVLSLKPFGCLPSSDLSDGILPLLLRRSGGPAFLAVETTGDADATLESRIDMVVQGAALEAIGEFEELCGHLRIGVVNGQRLVTAGPHQAFPLTGSRRYACSAAELLWRSERSSARNSCGHFV